MPSFLLSLFFITLLTSCSNQKTIMGDGAPLHHPNNLERTPDAIPKYEPKSRGGNKSPYEVFGKTYHVLQSSDNFLQEGIASWYGTKFHGNKTSNGEIYDMYAMTAAHKTLPIPTYVEVKNLANGKTIIVRVNDRGPFHGNRIIDLSYAAATKLGAIKNGTSPVQVRAINISKHQPYPQQPLLTVRTNSELGNDTRPVNRNLHPKKLRVEATSQALTVNPALPVGQLFIQVGAFETLDNAMKLQDKLTSNQGYRSTIQTGTKNYGNLYRVHVGPYIDIEEANSARLRLQKLGFSNALYINKHP
jgi:rare lipoprotein A